MSIRDVYIQDVIITDKFVEQWEEAPEQIRHKVDEHVQVMGGDHVFLKSFRPHKAKGTSDLYIGWVTKTNAHWRIMFTYENGIVTLHWLGNKTAQIQYLRTL